MDGRVLDFGTTGLLRFSNLVMYDRQTESWWQEFGGEAIVGELTGQRLEVLPNSIVSWKDFKVAFPEGKVLSRETGFRRPYGQSPYPGYDTARFPFLYDGPEDGRLPAMERVAAVDLGPQDSVAVPFSVLAQEPVVHLEVGGKDLVFFYKGGTGSALDRVEIAEGRDVGAVGVFRPVVGERPLTFDARDGVFVDRETGSEWDIFGRAITGPLQGERMEPVPHRAQFWFAWAVYRPEALLYVGEGRTVGGPATP